ncbi:MAG: hypothetical protein IAE99_04705 [Rhodothermales bacterium]|nr:hypothetical protein [Rhodothermales bacterium]
MNSPRPNPNVYIVLGSVFLVLAAVNGYLAWISPAESRAMKVGVAVVFAVLGVLRILRGITAKRLPP